MHRNPLGSRLKAHPQSDHFSQPLRSPSRGVTNVLLTDLLHPWDTALHTDSLLNSKPCMSAFCLKPSATPSTQGKAGILRTLCSLASHSPLCPLVAPPQPHWLPRDRTERAPASGLSICRSSVPGNHVAGSFRALRALRMSPNCPHLTPDGPLPLCPVCCPPLHPSPSDRPSVPRCPSSEAL